MTLAEQCISLKTRRKTEFKHNHLWLTKFKIGHVAANVLDGRNGCFVYVTKPAIRDFDFERQIGCAVCAKRNIANIRRVGYV